MQQFVSVLYNQEIQFIEKMIISNQEIAIHLHRVRNLTVYTSGKFLLRMAIEERGQKENWKAAPLTVIQKQVAQNQHRSEFDEEHFYSRPFNIKSSVNVDLDQIYIFKLDSPISNKDDEYELIITLQLIHSDNGKYKVVGTYNGRVNASATHEYLQIDYYQPAPCQIIGSFHRLPYKFAFKDGPIVMDLRQFCEKYYKSKPDQFLEYLQDESFKNYEKLAEYLNSIRKEQMEIDQNELQRKFVFKVLESQIDLYQRQTQLSNCEGSESSDDMCSENGKRRKRIFSISKQYRLQKYESFEKSLHRSAQKTYLLWRQLLQKLLSKDGQLYLQQQTIIYHKKLREKVKESITSCKGSKDSDLYGSDFNFQCQLVSKLRNTQNNYKETNINQEEQFLVYNKSFFTDHRPIFFQEKSAHYQEQQPQQMFVFLVHGLGACRLDMQKLKVELKRYYDGKVRVHSATTNEGRTQTDIDSLGMRLASEIDYQLSKLATIPKICLIGHSMGGLMIRSALPRLQKYKKYFHSFITFSSPHLGYAYSVSKIVDAGLWYMNTVKKCTSLMQMTMKDSEYPEQAFLYKLSQKPGLQWFKKIVFIGSNQDKYVPYYSARIQKHRESIQDEKQNISKGKTYCQMVEHIFKNVSGTIIRLNVNFSIPQNNLDNLIGRAAHLNFITSIEMVRAFALSAKHYIF